MQKKCPSTLRLRSVDTRRGLSAGQRNEIGSFKIGSFKTFLSASPPFRVRGAPQ